MSFSDLFARVVGLVGKVTIRLRHLNTNPLEPAFGTKPAIPLARPQGRFPTLKMPIARGWRPREKPVAAPGLQVNAFAMGLKHPRWLQVTPDGGILAAEAMSEPTPVETIFDYAAQSTMHRAAATGISPNRIVLLRDNDGDGVADSRTMFLEGLNQPFGMAFIGDMFYVGNTDGIFAFPYTRGADHIGASGRRLTTFKAGGHWTRSLLPSRDARKLYCGVGSLSNIGEHGMAAEDGRAAIYELDLASGASRIFASGLRNPVGLAWEPRTGTLWTVVNERDGLGDETPPDYLTAVRDGGFYGWPYCYWGQILDDRVRQDSAAIATAITPDYALGGHTASLGLCWLPAGTFPGFPEGMAIGQHGSWNRSILSGYKVIFVPFVDWQAERTTARHSHQFFGTERKSLLRPAGRGCNRSRWIIACGGRCRQCDLARDWGMTAHHGKPCICAAWRYDPPGAWRRATRPR